MIEHCKVNLNKKQEIAGLFYVERKLRHEKCYKSDVYPKLNTYNN